MAKATAEKKATTAKAKGKAEATRSIKVGRREGWRRFCRLCAVLTLETDFPEGNAWVCPTCLKNGVEVVMPLKEHAGHQRYDTERVFAGYRVVKIKQGAGREQYEVEVPSRCGEFWAVAEAAVGLYTKTAHTANILAKEFPEVRVVTRGDDGRCVVHFPAALFPKIARRCGAFKSRAGQPRSDKQVAAQKVATAKLAEARKTKGNQLALDM